KNIDKFACSFLYHCITSDFIIHNTSSCHTPTVSLHDALPILSSGEVIQAGIDSVEPGTRHCVRIVTVADGRYSVEVTEYRPGGAPATYSSQTVTTAATDGRTLITGITAGERRQREGRGMKPLA